MRLYRIVRAKPQSALFIFLGLFLLVGCGSNSTAGAPSNPAASAATATACAQATRPATTTSFKTATGTLQSISGQTLSLKDQQGKSATVTYSSSTRFTQETNVPISSLQEGTSVRVAVTSSGSTYTATNIVVTTGTTGATSPNGGFGGRSPRGTGTPGAGFGGANNPCFASGRFAGTPGRGTATTTTFRGIMGTVSQVIGNTLIVTDSTGAAYTVTVTSQTQIIETKSVTATALKVGQPLTVTGTAGSQGVIEANSVAILLSLPTRPFSPSPTP